MKIKSLSDQGTDSRKEDFLVDFPEKVLGVLDTGSDVFIPPAEPQMFYGMTGGQFVGQMIQESIGLRFWYESLEEILEKANDDLKKSVRIARCPSLGKPAELPFASYAIARLNGDTIEIIQGGDCQFVWQNRDGTFGWTENQTLGYERENIRLIAKYMREHNGDRNAMWQDFGPILKVRRNKYFNSPGGFSLLNGQPDFSKYWQQITLNASDVETLIGYTDGFVSQSATADMNRLTHEIITAYHLGGLQTILNNTRVVSEANKAETHITYPEATALAIEL